MAEKIAFRNGGKVSEEGLGKLFYYLLTDGILGSGHLAVTQRGAGANMSVDVAIGGNLIDTGLIYHYLGWNTATKNVTVTTANPTNPRKDILVYYEDLSVVSNASNDNPGALKFLVVAGTPASSPSDPSDPTIQSAVGASNPWKKIARINVAASASSITNANIDGLHTQSWIRPVFFGTANIPGTALADDGVTAAKLGDIQTASLGSTSWTNGIISGLTSTLQSGSSTNGTSHTVMTIDISGLSIPSTAAILESTFWVIPADNGGAKKTAPAVVTALAYNSVTIHAQYGMTTANALNHTNSAVLGRMRYID